MPVLGVVILLDYDTATSEVMMDLLTLSKQWTAFAPWR